MGDDFPVFWERALGSNVWDVDGNRLVDLTAAFGVALAGHNHPHLVEAATLQTRTLMHGMGDVHPPAAKVAFLERLQGILPEGLGGAILGLNGADAVEASLKAAYLHTGRPGILAFEGGYHGLLGMSLAVNGAGRFREPFAPMLGDHATFVPFPNAVGEDAPRILERIRGLLASPDAPGAVIVEPIQGRGGVVVPPAGFLSGLRDLCDGTRTVLILDEIFTGMGRTGARFAMEREGILPDLLVLGKALAGGMPLSACVGTPEVMASWPRTTGEAIHTATYLGHPVACAVGAAAIDVLEEEGLVERAQKLGDFAHERLSALLHDVAQVGAIRGRGLMLGVPLLDAEGRPSHALASAVIRAALRRGILILGSGSGGHVLSLTPAATIPEELLDWSLERLAQCIREQV